MQKRKYLLKLRRSRKGYLLIYLMIFIVIGTLVYLNYKGFEINNLGLWVSGIFVLLTFKFTEIHRLRDWWAITNSSLVQSKGILNKNVREVDFSSISDLDLDQPFFKRLLNYGDVNVRLFLNETSVCVRGINNPDEFLGYLQKMISTSGRMHNGVRKI